MFLGSATPYTILVLTWEFAKKAFYKMLFKGIYQKPRMLNEYERERKIVFCLLSRKSFKLDFVLIGLYVMPAERHYSNIGSNSATLISLNGTIAIKIDFKVVNWC
jgi:hypothetical protein